MKKFITILLLMFTTQMMGQVKVIEQVNNNKHTLLIFLDGQLHQVEKYVRRRDDLVPIGVWVVFISSNKLSTLSRSIMRTVRKVLTAHSLPVLPYLSRVDYDGVLFHGWVLYLGISQMYSKVTKWLRGCNLGNVTLPREITRAKQIG